MKNAHKNTKFFVSLWINGEEQIETLRITKIEKENIEKKKKQNKLNARIDASDIRIFTKFIYILPFKLNQNGNNVIRASLKLDAKTQIQEEQNTPIYRWTRKGFCFSCIGVIVHWSELLKIQLFYHLLSILEPSTFFCKLGWSFESRPKMQAI